MCGPNEYCGGYCHHKLCPGEIETGSHYMKNSSVNKSKEHNFYKKDKSNELKTSDKSPIDSKTKNRVNQNLSPEYSNGYRSDKLSPGILGDSNSNLYGSGRKKRSAEWIDDLTNCDRKSPLNVDINNSISKNAKASYVISELSEMSDNNLELKSAKKLTSKNETNPRKFEKNDPDSKKISKLASIQYKLTGEGHYNGTPTQENLPGFINEANSSKEEEQSRFAESESRSQNSHQNSGFAYSLHSNISVCYSQGSFYKGDISNKRRHGNGIMNYSDGTVYKGDWINDFKHGKGH